MNSGPLVFLWLSAILVSQVSPLSFGRWDRREERIENDSLKQVFLEKLGLSREPNVTRARTTQKEMEEMVEIYERSLRDYDESGTAEDAGGQRLKTFRDNARRTGKKDIHLLSFPVGEEERGLLLRSAKLHVYKKFKRSRHNSATVELYQLMESSMRDSPQSLLVESRRVNFDANDWEVFDVTNAVATWLETPSSNHGFLLICKECTRRHLVIVTADSSEEASKRALLDVSIVNSLKAFRKRSHPSLIESEEEVFNDCTDEDGENNLCCRHSMWVSFKDVGWDWVVKPEGFHAYYCRGECPYDYINYANTHALFQSIYNSKYDKAIPPPCCVPKSLKSLNLLHYNDNDPPQLVISKQTGMIAESCGCA